MSRDHSSLAGRRVLLVEDELLVAMDVEDLLADLGCEVLESASTVEQALQRIVEDSPDVVVLDLNLHGKPTLPVAEALRSAGIPFIVVTGYVETRQSDPALHNAPLLQKPCSADELLFNLRKVLNL